MHHYVSNLLHRRHEFSSSSTEKKFSLDVYIFEADGDDNVDNEKEEQETTTKLEMGRIPISEYRDITTGSILCHNSTKYQY